MWSLAYTFPLHTIHPSPLYQIANKSPSMQGQIRHTHTAPGPNRILITRVIGTCSHVFDSVTAKTPVEDGERKLLGQFSRAKDVYISTA